MGTEHDNFFKIVLNSESSALLKMSDVVGTVLGDLRRSLWRIGKLDVSHQCGYWGQCKVGVSR